MYALLGVTVVLNLIWVGWISRQRKSPPRPDPKTPLPAGELAGEAPIQRQRIDDYISAIERETLEQSIENMSLHESLIVRSAMETYPSAPSPRATERCLANRRLARVFEDFEKLPEQTRADRSQALFERAFDEFSKAANLILSRWEANNPPRDTNELFGAHRSIDGYFWAVCGAELICAQFGSAEQAVSNRQQMIELQGQLEARVARSPDRLTLPYSEIQYFLLPDLFPLNIATVVCQRHLDLNWLDSVLPDDMERVETRFYRWNAHTNEQDFTFQRRSVPSDQSRILHVFHFYPAWHEEGRLNQTARQKLIDSVWSELRTRVGRGPSR